MKRLFLIFVHLPLCLWANPHRGFEALERIDALPILRRGVSVHQVSSFDKSGGNADRNSWLYRDGQNDYVIFDDIGAGCIYRLWMTHGGAHPEYQLDYPSTRIKIYLDEDVIPRFECSFEDLFSGTVEPFVYPLVGNKDYSSGGFYSYVPIPYERRCRIALTDIPPTAMREMPWGPDSYWMYYNITYHKYSSTEGVVSWTGEENYDAVQGMLQNAGVDPKPISQNLYIFNQIHLSANSNCVLANIAGTGILNSIEFEMPPVGASQWSNIWLKVYWDEETEAAIDVPFGLFFGSEFGQTQVDGLLMGMHDSRCYCYFPMPFWQSARIVLENRSPMDIGPVSWVMGLEGRHYDRDSCGYFYARYAENNYTNSVVEPDFVMLEESGRGHVVGVVLSMVGAGKINGNGLAFLEGDERFYIDGSLTPQLHGTGNEDYFNGGWYYNEGIFSLPYHGSPIRSAPYGMNTETNYVSAYRLHIGDMVPFNSSVVLGIEHGGVNQVGCRMTSVSCYYRQSASHSGLRLCSEIDVGDPASEAEFRYQVLEGISEVATNFFCYTGDDHDVVIGDAGRYINGISSFSVPLPVLNDGMLIRRRTDTGVGMQQASVYVDDTYVAEWYFWDAGYSNVLQRWADCDLYVPFEYTAGKSNVVITLDASGNDAAWNEFRYSVYAVEQLVKSTDMDNDEIADAWEVAGFNNLIACVPGEDPDDDGFSNRDEYVCLTDPRDQDSYFSIKRTVTAGDNEFYFPTATSRIYQVMFTTNLASGVWQEAWAVEGRGGDMVLPVMSAEDNAVFYRVNVRPE